MDKHIHVIDDCGGFVGGRCSICGMWFDKATWEKFTDREAWDDHVKMLHEWEYEDIPDDED
jgi:hypothetical protein